MKKDTVNIIFGDSIAYGLGDTECFGWLNRLRKKDEKLLKEFFLNLSIPGQSSSEIVERFEFELKRNLIMMMNLKSFSHLVLKMH